jgi:Carboxypeptidase regulatory-like domain
MKVRYNPLKKTNGIADRGGVAARGLTDEKFRLLLPLALVLFTAVTLPQSESGLVTGRLLSADGTASAGVRVMAVPVSESGRGEQAEVLAAITLTDASGAYRLENLSPGRYYIRAGLVDSPTYYPGATTPSEARVITVARGSVQSGVDFVILRGAGVKISGRVVLDPRQKPSPELRRVMLARGAPFVAEAPTDENGAFEFLRVPPGSYSLVIRGAAGVRGVQVGDKDITGIEIRVPLRYEVTARMVVAGNGPLPKRPVGVFFSGSDLRGSQAQFLSDAPIKILFLEDSYRSVPNDIPEGYTVTSIMHGAVDLMKEPLRIPSDNTSEIVVTLSAQP